MIKKFNSLTVLAIVTAIMVILMFVTIQRPTETHTHYELLFPQLSDQLSQVNAIKVESQQDEFNLFKQGEDWFIKERANYIADFNTVKRTLVDISEAKIIERKTADAEQYSLLGVEGVEDGGESLNITLLAGDKAVAGLILGNEREVGQGQGIRRFYVRRQGESKSWLAEGYLNINPLMLNWIKTEVMNIDRERIAQVEIIQPNGDTATLVNLGELNKFGTPENLDKTVFKYQQLGYDIASSLYQLRMEDVQPSTGFSRGDADIVTAEFITFDGLKITTRTSFIDGAYFTQINAEYDANLIKEVPKAIADSGKLKNAQQVRQEVAQINTDLKDWVFRFSGFVGTNLMRAKADIVTEVDKVIPMPADTFGGQ